MSPGTGAARGAVLVTGGAGYVGAPVARMLHDAGRRVVVLDDLSTGRREAASGTLVVGDAGEASKLSDVIRAHSVTAILHFASKTSVEDSVRDPERYRESVLGVTTRLVDVAKTAGVRAIVLSSTAAVYGAPETVPIPETHPLRPESPYGAFKAEAERVVRASGVPAACLRYFNAAGAEPANGLGETHDPETHLIPIAIRAAESGRTLVVHGDDYPTPDGTCVRDYVHVRDLALAHLAALARLEDRGLSGTWNLGTGRGHSVLEVLDAVERATGRRVERRVGPRRAGDSPVLVADPSRARADLGWSASIVSLDRIVADAVAFERTRRHR